jgi:transcriptional regulator with XRE-family HTH domain
MQTTKERLVSFLKQEGVSWAKFAERTGLSRGFMSTVANNITAKTLDKITSAFPSINPQWLLSGEGNMLKLSNIGHSTAGNHSPISGDIQVNEHHEALLKILHLEKLLKEKDERLAELKTLYEQRLQDKDEIIALLKQKK